MPAVGGIVRGLLGLAAVGFLGAWGLRKQRWAMGDAAAPGEREVRRALEEAVRRGRKRVSPSKVKPVTNHSRLPVVPGLVAEDLVVCSEEDSAQGWVPLRIVVADGVQAGSRLPVVLFLHPTGKSMRSEHDKQMAYASAGYLTAAIDCRYHGERSIATPGQDARQLYQAQIVKAWRHGPEHPFLLDNVWDILHVIDYLCTRPDVDTSRIAITGTSLGGMHSWLASVLDPRIAVAAPMIGVQGFRWAVDHNQFQGRVESIPDVFKAAAADMGKAEVDAQVVTAVWHKIMPGLLDKYDAPLSLPLLAPRPLLVANGELDPRCPIPGVMEAWQATKAAYLRAESSAGRSAAEATAAVQGRLQLFVQPGVGHEATSEMNSAIRSFLDTHLLKSAGSP